MAARPIPGDGSDYTLFVGDYAYSSWSMRAWTLMDGFDVPFRHCRVHMRTPDFEALRAEVAPARLVPVLMISRGLGPRVIVWESLAIAETVHEHIAQPGVWPRHEEVRAVARSIVAEMHAGFQALRNECPMNLRRAYVGYAASEAVRVDLERLSQLWTHARGLRKDDGDFLFGPFSAADAFFAPVASRIVTYGLELAKEHMAYVRTLMTCPPVRRWRAMATADRHEQPHYELDLPDRPVPFSPEVAGVAVEGRLAQHDRCPFTGAPSEPDLQVEIEGRVLGFADRFTRDKVLADPLAWPEIDVLLR